MFLLDGKQTTSHDSETEQRENCTKKPAKVEGILAEVMSSGDATTTSNVQMDQVSGADSENQHKCSVCREEFSTLDDFREHLTTHQGHYECAECREKFPTQDALNEHVVLHANDKLFKCSVCSKEFKRDSHLKNHFSIHTGCQPYPCPLCSKSFSQASSRSRHVKTLHGGIIDCQCPHCDKSFKSEDVLLKHIKVVHGLHEQSIGKSDVIYLSCCVWLFCLVTVV